MENINYNINKNFNFDINQLRESPQVETHEAPRKSVLKRAGAVENVTLLMGKKGASASPEEKEAYDIMLNAGNTVISVFHEATSALNAEDLVDIFPRYKAINQEIEDKKKEIDQLSKIPGNEKAIHVLTDSVKELESEKAEIDKQLLKKGGATVLTSLISSGLEAVPLLGAIFESNDLKVNYKTAMALEKEIINVTGEIEDLDDEILKLDSKTALRDVLKLKLGALERQAEENKIDAVRNFSKLSGVITAFAVPEAFLGMEVGVETAAALGVLSVSTGVGICVFVGLSLAIGAGYLAYKKKPAIENAFQNITITTQEKYAAHGREQSLLELPELDHTMDRIKKNIEESTKTTEEEQAIEETIRSLKQQQQALRQGSTVLMLSTTIQKLTQQKLELTMQRAEKHKTAFNTVEKLAPRLEGLTNINTQLTKLGEERQKINDQYKYGRYLEKFKGDDISIDFLKKVEGDIKNMSEDDFKQLKTRFNIDESLERDSPLVLKCVVEAVTIFHKGKEL